MPALDPSVRFSTMSRASTILNRPQQAPMGPRTRSRSSNMSSESLSLPLSPPYASTSTSFATLRGGNLYLPEFGPGPIATLVEEEVLQLEAIPEAESEPAPSRLYSPPSKSLPLETPTPEESPPAFEAREAPLSQETPPLAQDPPAQQAAEDPVEEPPTHEPPDPPQLQEPLVEANEAPAYDEEDSTPHTFPEEPTIAKTPGSTILSLPSTASPSLPARTPSSSTIRTLVPPPKLTPPPTIQWDCEPVQWKGLTMDAALWTFDSKELQSIVSRAIRSSALESFIRLLTLENLDQTLPDELKRLESSKNVTQAKYRFLVHRRTMQLQALLSTSQLPPNPKDNDDGIPTATRLVAQLSETVAECDLLTEELLKITDQITQIKKLIDHHWASALAIALRKLNGSFGRRNADLSAAKQKILQLEASLEEAWNEAERMAREMDDIDGGMSDDDEGEVIIETAEKVTVALARTTSPSPGPDSLPLSPILLNSELKFDVNGASLMQLSQLSPLLPVSKAKASKENQTPTDLADSVSIRSAKSTKSTKSTKSIAGRESTRSASVSAARTRSYRASHSSLRLPSGVGRKHSNPSKPRTPVDNSEGELPPVPNLPLQFIPPPPLMSSAPANASSTLLHFDNSNTDTASVTYHMRKSSLDSSIGTYGHRTPVPWNSAMDDMFVGTAKRDFATTLGRSLARESDIQIVPRTPPPPAPKVISMDEFAARPRPRPPMRERVSKDGGSIPSIWMNVDAPKTTTERVESLIRGNSKGKNQTYQRLRTLTKRYSLPFPLFSSKSNSSASSAELRPSSHRSG